MSQKVDVKNGVSVLELEEVVIGSQLKISALFERLISENPDVFEPINFTGMSVKADIKLRPSKQDEPDASFVCDIRETDVGWIDFTLDGAATGALKEKTYEASVKVWPTVSPEQGDTLWVILLPMKYKATR